VSTRRWTPLVCRVSVPVVEQPSAAPADVEALFAPASIGGVTIRNRVVLAPMTTRLADGDGHTTAALSAYYRARARGGVGLVTVEMASPELAGKHRFGELGIYDDVFLPDLRRLVAEVRSEEPDVRLSVQLGHAGSRSRRAVSGRTPVAPSAIPTSVFEIEREVQTPEEMTAERIEETTVAFLAAARRARDAGFDLVELHAAHGYLISQFLTEFENRRTDDYGGNLRNRARFGLDILRRIKTEMPGFPVIFRIGVEDFFAGGMSLADGVEVARWAAEAGADAVSVTAGHYLSLPNAERMIPPMIYPEGAFLEYAAAVKKVVDVPVIAVGRLGDPRKAARAIDDGHADLVALARPLLADPDWVNKARAGIPVRRCLSCNHCVNHMRSGAQISCVVNPRTGHELDYAGSAPRAGERVVVIGAGPAGLSYASLVAEGNQVVVLERATRAGGAFRQAGKAPRFNDVRADEGALTAYITELERDCERLGVELCYGSDAAAEQARLERADRVVVATGARYRGGLGCIVPRLLDSGLLRSKLGDRVFRSVRLREALYYRLRVANGAKVAAELGLDPDKTVVIGDAASAGKAREAVASAFEAALLSRSATTR
jgi:2,4-dienoyl-CoA reductase-like NADH-dependent reductase (Old Yellow Enzyme family)